MRLTAPFVLVFCGLVACGSSEWVHPTKPKDQFLQDWNACESRMLRDPKLQQGNKFLLDQATERCVMKDGWILREQR
jgi:hypothetical protein